MPNTAFRYAATLSVTAMALSPAVAQPLESLPDLEQRLLVHLAETGESPRSSRDVIDRRLRLKKCPEQPVFERRNAGMITVQCEALNWRISVPLQGSQTSRAAKRTNAVVIKRGQPVLMVAKKSGFTISRQMTAERNGAVGDVIPVRATRKSTPILAEILGPGRVTLPSY